MEDQIVWMDQMRIIAPSRVDQNSLLAQLVISVYKRYLPYILGILRGKTMTVNSQFDK